MFVLEKYLVLYSLVCWIKSVFSDMYNIIHTHVLMRDEKDGRKKQARLNKQQGKANIIYMF